MKTEEMLERLKKEDYVKYFNRIVRDDWWKKENKVKESLFAAIPYLINGHDFSMKYKIKMTYIKKLAGNYNYIPCNLITNKQLKAVQKNEKLIKLYNKEFKQVYDEFIKELFPGKKKTDLTKTQDKGVKQKAKKKLGKKPTTPVTTDHIVGVLKIGNVVDDSIEEESLRLDNYKDWIYNNLFIWGRVDMTKKEHKSVTVNPPTLLDNVRFNHYPKPLQKEIIEKTNKN